MEIQTTQSNGLEKGNFTSCCFEVVELICTDSKPCDCFPCRDAHNVVERGTGSSPPALHEDGDPKGGGQEISSALQVSHCPALSTVPGCAHEPPLPPKGICDESHSSLHFLSSPWSAGGGNRRAMGSAQRDAVLLPQHASLWSAWRMFLPLIPC